jgi:hypothetical protein
MLVNSIKMDLVEIGWGGLDLSGLGWVQVGWSCELGNEPSGSTEWCETTEWLHNSSGTQLHTGS